MSKSTRRTLGLEPDGLTLLCVVACLALAVLPHLPRLPLWYPLLLIATAGERLGRWRFKRPPLPAWLRLALTAAAIYGVWLSYGNLVGRQPGIALLCVMLALKLLESNRRRDVYLLLTVAYFVVISQFLFDQSITMALFMGLVVVMITATLMVVEMQPMREQKQTTSPQPTLAIGRAFKNAALMLAQALPLTLLVFLLFPRLGSPLWGVPESLLDAKTGVGDEMEPGRFLELFIDDSPAFRVTFEGPLPAPNERYWRGPGLWDFDGHKWSRPRPFPFRVRIDQSRVEPAHSYRVSMEPSQRHWLFALDIPTKRPREGGLAGDFTPYRNKPTTSLFNYTMRSDPNYAVNPDLGQGMRRRALRLPPARNPRAIALAEQWRAQLGGDATAIANQALRMFRNQTFEYSYQPPPLLGQHTVDDFLFNTRSGYCEYYASAFTVLMRAAGIPARVITGYQGGDYIEAGDYLLVRQSDAHAWSEIWVEGQGWQRMDPTAAIAPERVNLGARQMALGQRGWMDWPWVGELRNQLDALHNLWNEWVIQFDAEQQKSILTRFGIERYQTTISVLILVALSTLIIIAIMLMLSRAQGYRGLDPVARAYARYCRKLARAGLPRKGSEGPRDYGRRAILRFQGRRRSIADITRLYIRLRYATGGQRTEQTQLLRLIRRFRLHRRDH